MPPGSWFPFVPGARGLPTVGGQPAALPQVAMVAVTSVTATGGRLVGSINPQGLAGSWWFVYGQTPQFGSQTVSQAIAATSIPYTATVSLTGLTQGATYYVAMVGQSAGGTVTSAPVTFTPTVTVPVVNPAALPTPATVTRVGVPHYAFPIQFAPATGVATVQQDSLAEVFSNVQAIVACTAGACPELPTLGVPDVSFSPTPVDSAPLVAAVRRWEPRATETAASQALGDSNAGAWQVTLTTRAGAG